MAEKVTVRFEQFDSEGSGDIITSGPIIVDGQVEQLSQLDTLVYKGPSGSLAGRPTNPLTDSFYLQEDVNGDYTLFQFNGTAYEEYAVPNKTYFFSDTDKNIYEYSMNEWQEKPSQSLVYYVRNVFEKISEGIEESKYRGVYYSYNYLFDGWQEILLGTHSHENKEFLDRLGAVDITGPVGTKKFFTLEIKDTDDSDATYEYDINWEDLPKALPQIPEDKSNFYLGYDEDGNPEWKNNFVAAQSFQVVKQVVAANSTSISFENIQFNPVLDTALVMSGKIFVHNINVNYTGTTLTINLISDPTDELLEFDAGETVTLILIRNGAGAILDQLASGYWSKEEALHVLSGGSVNLKDYAKKSDLLSLARKYHTHSQFAREDHTHDYRYALYHHNHDDRYLTRRGALNLIEEVLAIHPDIVDKLQAISDYLVANMPALATLATKTDIDDINNQINIINSTLNTRIQDYLDSESVVIQSEKVKTNFVDEGGINKNLNQVLTELRNDLDNDYGTIKTSETELDETITVNLGADTYMGGYDNGDQIASGSTMYAILQKLFTREIFPTYTEPSVSFQVSYTPNEIGTSVNVTVTPTFIKGNSGGLNEMTLKKIVEGIEETVASYNEAPAQINFETLLTEENVEFRIETSYKLGLPLYSNLNNVSPGQILAGNLDDYIFTVDGKRAVFFGSFETNQTLNSALVRSTTRYIPSSYTSFEIEMVVPSGRKYMIFAMPQSEGNLTRIIYKDQGNVNIIDKFGVETITVDAANGLFPALYNVYYYELPLLTMGEMSLVFKK